MNFPMAMSDFTILPYIGRYGSKSEVSSLGFTKAQLTPSWLPVHRVCTGLNRTTMSVDDVAYNQCIQVGVERFVRPFEPAIGLLSC